MTYQQSLKRISESPFSRADRRDYYGKIERVRAFLSKLGSPDRKLKVIVIGGTVGKGSTCYYVARMLAATGARVGMSISPHLQSPRERIQINGRLISKPAFSKLVSEYLVLAQDLNLSFPEFMVGLAARHFAKAKLDWAVFEVGLGGRYDPVNALTPVVSAITNIASDHEYKLGTHPSTRLREKYAIARKGLPLVTGVTQASLRHWLKCQCKIDGLALRFVSQRQNDFRLNDLAIAKDILTTLGYKKSPKINLLVPGRYERLATNLLIDSAHNKPGFGALKRLLRLEGLGGVRLLVASPGNSRKAIDKFVRSVAAELNKGSFVCATGSVFAVGALRDIWHPVD